MLSTISEHIAKVYKDSELEKESTVRKFRTVQLEGGYTHNEMLHCFGAHDLYYSNSDIPQEYVDHLAEIGSEDIMYMVYDSEEILNELD